MPLSSQGLAMVCLTMTGTDVAKLDQEAGIHRVQRVPLSEKRGRVHTSDVMVVVLDPQTPLSFHPASQRRPEDFQLEWYSGSGAGGQHRNKHMNCARLTHLPTGLVKTSQNRSRYKSQTDAQQALDLALDGLIAEHQKTSVHQVRTFQQNQEVAKKRLWAFQRDWVDDGQGRGMSCKQAKKGQLNKLWR